MLIKPVFSIQNTKRLGIKKGLKLRPILYIYRPKLFLLKFFKGENMKKIFFIFLVMLGLIGCSDKAEKNSRS